MQFYRNFKLFWEKFITKLILLWRVPSLLFLCRNLLLLIRNWNEFKEGQAFYMNLISCFFDFWIGEEGWLREKSVKIINISPYETNNRGFFPTCWENFQKLDFLASHYIFLWEFPQKLAVGGQILNFGQISQKRCKWSQNFFLSELTLVWCFCFRGWIGVTISRTLEKSILRWSGDFGYFQPLERVIFCGTGI